MAEANTAVHGENQVERRLIRPREIAAYALTSYGLNNLTTYVGSTKQYFMMSFLGLSGTAYGTLSTIATVWDALEDRYRASSLTAAAPVGAGCARF